MDGFEHFYQQLDSEALLRQHGPDLAAEARTILQRQPTAKLAGVILEPDAKEARQLRALLEQNCSEPIPSGLLVGLVPREFVVDSVRRGLRGHPLVNQLDDPEWRVQRHLPVVVATRDGHRFGMLPCTPEPTAPPTGQRPGPSPEQ